MEGAERFDHSNFNSLYLKNRGILKSSKVRGVDSHNFFPAHKKAFFPKQFASQEKNVNFDFFSVNLCQFAA